MPEALLSSKLRPTLKIIRDISVLSLLALLLVKLTAKSISYCDDEYIVYRGFSCLMHPPSVSPLCSGWRLGLPGLLRQWIGELPLLSYYYVGWPQALLYWPLKELFPSFLLTRWLGLMGFAAQAYLVARHYSIRPWALYICLLCFAPWSFQQLFDTGQHVAQLPFLVLTILWLENVGNYERYSPARFLKSILIGIGLSIAIWARLSFVFVLPGIALLTMYHLVRRFTKRFFVRTILDVVPCAAVFALWASILLFSELQGAPYYNVMNIGLSKNYLWDIFAHRDHFTSTFLPMFLNPVYATNALKMTSGITWSATAFLYIVLFLLYVYSMRFLDWKARIYSLMVFACGLLTLVIVNASPRSWAGHHLVYSFPYFLIAFVYNISKSPLYISRCFAATCVSFSFGWYQINNALDYEPWRNGTVPMVLDEIRAHYPPNSRVIVTAWGIAFGAGALLPDSMTIDYLDLASVGSVVKQMREGSVSSKQPILVIVQDYREGIAALEPKYRTEISNLLLPAILKTWGRWTLFSLST